MKQNRVIKRAILSVSDKTGIIEFASELRNLGSYGSTSDQINFVADMTYEISKLKDENSADEIKRLESKVQELTDKYVNKIDELLLVKQNELLEV